MARDVKAASDSMVSVDPSALALAGAIFADAFARYTAQVIAHLKNRDFDVLDLAPLDSEGPSKEEVLGLVSSWAQRIYDQAPEEEPDAEELEAVKARVGRNRLVSAMRERGITQAELARRAKMKPTSISRILKKPERSRVETIRKIAAAIEVNLSEIM